MERRRAGDTRCRDGLDPVGDCEDNALAERFFAIRQCELLARQMFRTRLEGRTATCEYIEICHHPRVAAQRKLAYNVLDVRHKQARSRP